MKNKNSKLFSLIENFSLSDYYSLTQDNIKFVNIDSLPFMYYPNGIPCYEANSYLIYKLKSGYSQRGGGTYRIIANHLTHLIRFLYNSNNLKNFIDFDDNTFCDFVSYLLESSNIRSNNHIINICHQVIDFFFYIGDLYNLERFIGIGSKFKIRLSISKNSFISKNIKQNYKHYSFPSPNPFKKRFPVTLNDYNKLLNYINTFEDEGIRLRNMCLIQALENTGGRLTEVCSISLNSLRDALKSKMKSPLLTLISLKNINRSKVRTIPVSRNFLLNLKYYVQNYRNVILERNHLDHDYVFIAHTTGNPLSSSSLTTYINKWSKEAKLSTTVCAHMFRHRFITEKFKVLILEHELQNTDNFRKILLNTSRLKQIMLEWTGHNSIDSLDTYINLAFEELIEINQLKDKILEKPHNYSIQQHVQYLDRALDLGQDIDPHVLRDLLIQLKK